MNFSKVTLESTLLLRSKITTAINQNIPFFCYRECHRNTESPSSMISLTEADILDNIIKWNATELEPEIITENVKGENATNLKNNIYHIIEDTKVPSVNCNTLNISDFCEINTYDTFEISVVIVLFLLIVVTVIGNTLIISAVVTTKRLRTVTNCFVTSLAAADLMVGIFVMPPAIAVHISGKLQANSIFFHITNETPLVTNLS